jgi:(p)ppGpp synthase/HD superfamily hydrolase
MNYDLISETITFIQVAHEGQLYGELPYFLHPIKVANNILNATENEYIAALLHDVVEDTSYTLSYIAGRWNTEVADIVALLTKDNSLSYEDNISRIIDSGNVSAMLVKYSDNLINQRGDKSAMKPERAARLNKKYEISSNRLFIALVANKQHKEGKT